LRGPIPWAWACAASRLTGASLNVAVALWLEVGMNNNRLVKLSMARLRELGVTRWSAYRALAALEAANLVAVERREGRLARVLVLEHPEAEPGRAS
jgi:hypothetical protein